MYCIAVWRGIGDLVLEKRTRIRSLRIQQSLTKRALAEMLGVSINTVCDWENKSSIYFKIESWVKLAALCRCDVAALIDADPPLHKATRKSLENIRCSIQESSKTTINLPKFSLVHLRERIGLSQADIADLIDVSVNTYQNWENNRTTTHQFVLMLNFCDALLCKPEELIEEYLDNSSPLKSLQEGRGE